MVVLLDLALKLYYHQRNQNVHCVKRKYLNGIAARAIIKWVWSILSIYSLYHCRGIVESIKLAEIVDVVKQLEEAIISDTGLTGTYHLKVTIINGYQI